MTAEQTLYTTLTGDGDVSPLIINATSPVTWRLFPSVAPDNVVRPFVVYSISGASKPVDLSDIANIENARFQIDVYDTTSADARTLADHIIDAINTNMKLTEAYIVAQYENETKLHRYLIDCTVWV